MRSQLEFVFSLTKFIRAAASAVFGQHHSYATFCACKKNTDVVNLEVEK